MKKRVLSIALALLMVLALLPFGALAAEGETPTEESSSEPVVVYSGTCGETATFEITSDGVMTVTGTGIVKEKKITYRNPDESVKANVTKLVISDGVTEIGPSAFREYDFLKEVILPDSVTAIRRYAFDCCWNLTDIRWSSHLESIGYNAFCGARFTELVLPETVKTIGEFAFSGCPNLQSAVIYGEMRQGSFLGNDNLETVAVMNATALPSELFRMCPKLKNVYLADTIKKLGGSCFESCISLTELRIPAKVTTLPGVMFRGCTSLKTLIVPALQTIYGRCFDDCPALEAIYYAGTESQFNKMQVYMDGNKQLENVQFYLIPGMPDPIYGFFDMPEMTNWAYEGIAFCLDNGYMNGMGDGYFQPGGVTTRAQLVTILWRMCGEPKPTQKIPFTDCNIAWAKDAIAWAAENNIVNGIGKGLFNPNGPITREQLVTVFYRFCREYLQMDVSASQSLGKFPDAGKVSAWAKDGMQWGTAVGLISGVGTKTGTELQPKGSATRAQIARVIMNFCTNVAPQD